MVAVLAVPLIFDSTDAAAANKCGGVDTSIISCNTSGSGIEGTGLWALLLIGLNVLTGLVGVAAVAGIVYGAIMYTTAGGDQGKVEKAIEIIRNVVIGIVAYALMYVGLNFIIPGGVFG